MNFNGAAKRLDDVDLPKLAREIGCGEDEIHAILDVEAAGDGFDAHGRPKMLFEPHRFYRNLTGAHCDLAVQLGLAYPKWGTKPYLADSYPRLMQAMAINETAALLSCSWGLGQIMGEHHAALDYKTVQDMVTAFCADEENQLRGMIDFIKAEHLDDELGTHTWAGFARGYNGAGYAQNRYDTKLGASFAKWKGIKDTPFMLPSLATIKITPQIAPAAPVQAPLAPPARQVAQSIPAPVVAVSVAAKPIPVLSPAAPLKSFWAWLFSNHNPKGNLYAKP
jgi:N-acetylmuramidase